MKEAVAVEGDTVYLQSDSVFMTGKDNLFRNADYSSWSLCDLCFIPGLS